MSLKNLTEPFPWARYSKKLAARIENPHNGGFFTATDAEARGMRLVEGRDGTAHDGNSVVLYWLLDTADGTIVDARFQVFGQTALIGAADAACDLLVGKNYDQAQRIGADLIDKQLRDRSEESAFANETHPHLNLVLTAIYDAADQCVDIPLPSNYVAPPMPTGSGAMTGNGYPGWDDLPKEQKLAVVEQVLDQEIRPYIALDAGGVDVVSLTAERELIVAYKGSCTSCYSSVGTTLAYIQQMLRAKVHPQLVVIPDADTTPMGSH